VLIKDPPENPMVSFNFTNAMLDEGTTFTFGPWFSIANGCGGFNSHLAETREPMAWHLLQHPVATLMASLIISANFGFLI
jgi:hypothetical protein